MEPRDITADFDGIEVSSDDPITDLNYHAAARDAGRDPVDRVHVSAEISAEISECMSRIDYVEGQFFDRFKILMDAAEGMQRMVVEMRDDVERIKGHLAYVCTSLQLDPLSDD